MSVQIIRAKPEREGGYHVIILKFAIVYTKLQFQAR